MKSIPARVSARRIPVLVPLCLLFCLGAALGLVACRAVGPEQTELAAYLEQYARVTAEGQGPVVSALSVAVVYLRYPLAALLLGLAGGALLLPLLWALQGFFLSFSVACFASAMGRGGVVLALAAFGPRCLFVLPCTLYLTVQGLSAAALRRGRQPPAPQPRRQALLCALLLLLGMALELTLVPRLLTWVMARIIGS